MKIKKDMIIGIWDLNETIRDIRIYVTNYIGHYTDLRRLSFKTFMELSDGGFIRKHDGCEIGEESYQIIREFHLDDDGSINNLPKELKWELKIEKVDLLSKKQLEFMLECISEQIECGYLMKGTAYVVQDDEIL